MEKTPEAVSPTVIGREGFADERRMIGKPGNAARLLLAPLANSPPAYRAPPPTVRASTGGLPSRVPTTFGLHGTASPVALSRAAIELRSSPPMLKKSPPA